MTKTISALFCLIFMVSLAFGQQMQNNNSGLKKLDRVTAAQAWAQVQSAGTAFPSRISFPAGDSSLSRK